MKLLLDFILVMGLLVNSMILFILFKNEHKEYHRRILFAIFFLVLLVLICFYGFLHKIPFLFYSTFVFEDVSNVCFGPLLLLYVKSIFLPTDSLIKKNLIHFIIPFFYLIFISIPFLVSTWCQLFIFSYLEYVEDLSSLSIIYSLIYCFVSLNVLKKVRHIMEHYYSNTSGIDLIWIKKLLYGGIIVISLDIFTTIMELLIDEKELPFNSFYVIAIGVSVFVGYVGYYGIMQSKVLLPEFLLKDTFDIEKKSSGGTAVKEQKKGEEIDASEVKEQIGLLKRIMREDKPFLDPNISLKSLASLVSITDKKLSALLNQYMNISFYDYINGYRVEEVKKKINDRTFDHLTLLAIAYDSGFNSKTSFNRIFKKIEGISPSEYKKLHSDSNTKQL
ncbi:AraC family transcriptional regulator [Aquimarina hainanensis]